MSVSLTGIFLGLVLLMILAYRGCSIIWVSPLCAVIVAVTGGMGALDGYVGAYMRGLADYVLAWFPAFFLGAVYGKLMDMTGSARSLANKLVELVGADHAVLAVVVPCLLMTYGGVSLFVAVFVVYPMGYAVYRRANLPRTLLPAAIAFGAFGITSTSIPGTPQIQNLIPTEFYGTTPMAAPLLSIVATVLIGVPGYLYLAWSAARAKREGLGFVGDGSFTEAGHEGEDLPSWHYWSGLVPIVVVFLLLNIFGQHIVTSLLGGIVVCGLMNIRRWRVFVPAVNAGANGSLAAIMNTACAVGFGSVVKIVPGFSAITALALSIPGSLLFSEAIVVGVLAGATGSASGGISITLDALAPQYLAEGARVGFAPEVLHRIASIAAGSFSNLPHNGAVITLLAVSNCSHKESYRDICIATCVIPAVVTLGLALTWPAA